VEAVRGNGPVVFVGNGLSDRCGARAADFTFAKDDLAGFCAQEGIRFQPFASFDDVNMAVAV
jgi:2-hydroxy-3-keto-5-methylthiopentenyl-1-phosphate phosphatase